MKQIPYDEARKLTGEVLIEFYASWCPHCQAMMPVVENVKELLGSQVPVFQYDIDRCPDAANLAGVDSVPTFIISDNNREMWRHTGEISGAAILAKVDSILDSYTN